MIKLFFVCIFIAIAAADVSHLFRGNRPQYQPYNSQYRDGSYNFARYEPQYRIPRPVVPIQPQPGVEIPILRSDSNISPDGSYEYAYETANGITAQEQGSQKSVGPDSGTVAQGSFQYISPEGVPVAVQYVADENGFQPQSDVLPTPPPIPNAILRSLEWNAAHPEPEQVYQGQTRFK